MFDITKKQEEEYIQEMRKVFYEIENHKISETIPKDLRFYLDYSNHTYREAVSYRDRYIRQVGFARITKDWVRPLAKWISDRKCLEIMAGSGALTYALREEGVKVKATDDFSWKTLFQPWVQVENIDCIAAIEKYGKAVNFVICSWPCMDDTAYKALLKMREVNSKCRMIYIGEGYCGCTADDDFFNIVVKDDIKGFYEAVKKFSSWEGIHDYSVLYK